MARYSIGRGSYETYPDADAEDMKAGHLLFYFTPYPVYPLPNGASSAPRRSGATALAMLRRELLAARIPPGHGLQ